jgi:hypothetical protein
MSFIGIQINKHYSQGKLYSVSVYQEAESCCQSKTCDMEIGSCMHKAKKACSCENETEIIKINDVFISEKFSIPNPVTSVVFGFAAFLSSNTNKNPTYFNIILNNSLLPPLECDFQADFGVFLC